VFILADGIKSLTHSVAAVTAGVCREFDVNLIPKLYGEKLLH
jgi:hypothetical protein